MGDQTPLTNADFRKFLTTPRRDQPTPSGKPGSTPKRDGNKSKRPFNKPKPEAEKGEEDASAYRDRAAERRRGLNPDYLVANQLINNVLGSGGDMDTSKLSIEDSKYLGGDLEHTHLVKGLDYALLHKTRSTMQKGEGEGEEGAAAGGCEAGAQAAPKREDLTINHPAAKGVYAALFASRRSNIYEQFLPRRAAFVYTFEADEDGVVPDIPTTLRRSKADCPAPPEAVFARVDTTVLERIAKIMSYVKTGKDGRKLKRKDKDELIAELAKAGAAGATAGKPAAAAAGAKQVPTASTATPDEPDIFEDAGTDYKPSVSGKKKAAPAAAAAGAGDDMDLEDGEMGPPPPLPQQQVPPPPQYAAGDPYAVQQQHFDQGYQQGYNQQWGTGGYDQYGAGVGHERGAGGADVPKWRVRTGKVEERMVDFVDDAYGEYYPMAGGGEVPVLDEEEDGKEGKSKEAAAAAGKPGARPDGGETPRGGRGKGGETPRDVARAGQAKLNSQLQKIEGLFKDKGFDTAGFGRTPGGRDGAGGRTPRIQTGDDPNLNVTAKKRQRI